MKRWKLQYRDQARDQLKKLDRQMAERIARYLNERVITAENPRQLGLALQGRLRGYWRYRVGDYRILCDIQDEVVIVLVLAIGHRRDVYA